MVLFSCLVGCCLGCWFNLLVVVDLVVGWWVRLVQMFVLGVAECDVVVVVLLVVDFG